MTVPELSASVVGFATAITGKSASRVRGTREAGRAIKTNIGICGAFKSPVCCLPPALVAAGSENVTFNDLAEAVVTSVGHHVATLMLECSYND